MVIAWRFAGHLTPLVNYTKGCEVGLLILIIAMVLLVIGTLWWCERKVPSGQITCGMGLWGISRREFDALLNKRKFSAITSWVNTPYLSQFFAGTHNGLNTCIFTIAKDRYTPITLGVLLTSLDLPFPNFTIRPKSFSQEVGDMLGIRDHRAAFPQSLMDKYDISSEDDGSISGMLTPEIVSFFLENEGLSAELQSGALLITPSLTSFEKNYGPAVQRAHALAQLLIGRGECNRSQPRRVETDCARQ